MAVRLESPQSFPSDEEEHEYALTAYRIRQEPRISIVRAPAARAWMDATPARWPYRCLPLIMANQSGWFLLNSHAFFAGWDGGDSIESVRIVYPKGTAPFPAESIFGYGMITWTLPFLFRTPSEYNLLVRGPANHPKHGVYPLEGLVETDWSTASFTMTWQITRPNTVVAFNAHEPICMIVPQRRGELEAFHPEIRDIDSAPRIASQYAAFARSRIEFRKEHPTGTIPPVEAERAWQKYYFRGYTAEGLRSESHQTRRDLRDFDGDVAPGPVTAQKVPNA